MLPAFLCAAEGGGASESFEVPSLAGAWPLLREEYLQAMGTPLSLLGVSGLKVGGAASVGEKLCIFAMWCGQTFGSDLRSSGRLIIGFISCGVSS